MSIFFNLIEPFIILFTFSKYLHPDGDLIINEKWVRAALIEIVMRGQKANVGFLLKACSILGIFLMQLNFSVKLLYYNIQN